MKVSAEKFTIRLPRPFRIAHGTSQTRDTILAHIQAPDSDLVGHGEGALPPYYSSTAEACLAWLRAPEAKDSPDTAAARAALDIARHDLAGLQAGRALWELLGLDANKIPPCARTLSIPLDEAELRQGFAQGVDLGSRSFKLKLGSGDASWDERCVRIARAEFPDTVLSLDANSGWTVEVAAELILRFTDLGVEYIEQPIAADWVAWRRLRELLGNKATSPLIADESIQSVDDISIARELAQGVNIKLLKAGGLTGARAWVEAARSEGLRILLGGMVETGIGRSATAQLSPLADWLDIDPADSIPTAPMVGYELTGDRLSLSRRPGLGLLRVD